MLTIQLPENLERSIQAQVHNGHFASVDDAITEAVRLLLLRLQAESGNGAKRPAADAEAETVPRPIWEVFADISASVPEAEWAELPPDGAEQHDHYIYGTPKRPTS